MTGSILRNQAREGTLDRYAQIILDEAHVFDLNTEFLLSQCIHHFRTANYKFRITLMFATISKGDFLKFFKQHGDLTTVRAFTKSSVKQITLAKIVSLKSVAPQNLAPTQHATPSSKFIRNTLSHRKGRF